MGRSVGLVDKALGKGSTWAMYLELNSRSGTFEAKTILLPNRSNDSVKVAGI